MKPCRACACCVPRLLINHSRQKCKDKGERMPDSRLVEGGGSCATSSEAKTDKQTERQRRERPFDEFPVTWITVKIRDRRARGAPRRARRGEEERRRCRQRNQTIAVPPFRHRTDGRMRIGARTPQTRADTEHLPWAWRTEGESEREWDPGMAGSSFGNSAPIYDISSILLNFATLSSIQRK